MTLPFLFFLLSNLWFMTAAISNKKSTAIAALLFGMAWFISLVIQGATNG